ncbi:MAG: HNH endonuclease signature motif containing protein [Deltaproteobacteria bacterium]|nr:HNH endonuclease signature motif containing protein [Deltaproteobacteria bacterium]
MSFASKEKARAYRAAYYAENKERVKKSIAAWRARNPEKVKGYLDKWREKNPTRGRDYSSGYRKENSEKVKINNKNRHARKKGSGGKLSPDIASRLFAIQKGKCSVCKKSLKKTGFHLDHIVPLIRGGKNEDKNIQLTCPKCNTKKGGKDPIRFMQEQGFLL